ncbi:MAG TPA: hypothetical protein PLB88_02440 [Thermoanaerobaculaceae bacterium]|nr:hypothetical protein [Thermoanaerobaculaceae bacterium]HQU33148.1 hypothetical protein [Thermoanaerobaculaceae bacterium]
MRAITGGRGVRVVYDAVGRGTWEGSLDCLQPLGMEVAPIDPPIGAGLTRP